jgi:hypothetical protein
MYVRRSTATIGIDMAIAYRHEWPHHIRQLTLDFGLGRTT